MRNSGDQETKKGLWSKEEDDKLVAYINRYRIWNWTYMPKAAGLARSGKSCRLRWMNYLRPNLRHGNFSPEEEDEIIRLHRLLGNRWAAIAEKFPGRTDNDIKNYWNTRLKRRARANDGDRDGPRLIPNSVDDSAISAETPASVSGNQDGSHCSFNQLVIPDSSCDISLDDLLGVNSSEVEIESLWSELPPLGNHDTLLGHHFLQAPDWYEYSGIDAFSFYGQHGDHVDASSSCYNCEDEFSVDLWGVNMTNIY